MMFWSGIYITLSPLTTDGTYTLTAEDFTFDVEPTPYDTAACCKFYILLIFQLGLGIASLTSHMLGLLLILCFGNDINSIATCLPNAIKTDDEFLARLDAALTLGGILQKGYIFMRAVGMYLVNSETYMEITDRREECCDKKFPMLNGTNGVSVKSGEVGVEFPQASSKLFASIDSGYTSTAEDEITGENGITQEHGITGGDGDNCGL